MDIVLPPKPDLSGDPRPPQAPELYVWSGLTRKKRMINSRWGRRAIPTPPDGWGPPLEWWRGSMGYFVLFVFWFALAGAVFLTIKEGGRDWAADWTMWLALILIPTVLTAFMNNDRPIAAGAHWLYHKRRWIRTYELESVRVASGLTANDLALGQDGKEVLIRVDNLQENPALWDLVYNGIRHSVFNGAKVIDDTGAKWPSARSMLNL